MFDLATLRVYRKRRLSVRFRRQGSIGTRRCLRVVHLGASMLLTTDLGVNTLLKKTSSRSTRRLCSFNVGLNITFRLGSSFLSICNSTTIFKGGVKNSVLYGGGACVLVGTFRRTSRRRLAHLGT